MTLLDTGYKLNFLTMTKQKRIDFDKPKYPPTAILEEVGDILEGEVTGVGEVTLSDRIAGYLRIKPEGEEEVTFWLGKVLSEDVVREEVKKGDYVGIKYLGDKPSHKGNPYKDYDMRVIVSEPAFEG